MDDFLEDFAPANSATDLQNNGSQDEDIYLRYDASPAEVVHMIEQLACNFCDQLGTLSTVPDLVLMREHTLNSLCTSLCEDTLCLLRFFVLCGIWLVGSCALRSDTCSLVLCLAAHSIVCYAVDAPHSNRFVCNICRSYSRLARRPSSHAYNLTS